MLRDWVDIDLLLRVGRVATVVMVPGNYFGTWRRFDAGETRVLGIVPRARPRNESIYQTAPIMPRGDDGGFAERFLNDRARGRDT